MQLQIPKKIRLFLSKHIYSSLVRNDIGNINSFVDKIVLNLKSNNLRPLNEKNNKDLLDLSEKLKNLEFEMPFRKYIIDLIEIITRFINLDELNKPLLFKTFARKLENDGYNLNLKLRSLEKPLKEIYHILKENFKDEFHLRHGKAQGRGKSEAELTSIRTFKKKYKLAKEISNGRYNGLCAIESCNVDFKMLPSLEFHHTDKSLKTTSFTDIALKPYEYIKKKLEEEQVILLCGNCHALEYPYYKKFREIISLRNLFTYTPKEINILLDNEIEKYIEKTNENINKADTKFQIKAWIKKRSIIEQLYDGKCVGCCEVTAQKNLAALHFHHINPEKKQTVRIFATTIRKLKVKEVIQLLIEEECICLCNNCHSMVLAKHFENNVEEIIGFQYVDDVNRYYKKLYENIEYFILIMKNFDGKLVTNVFKNID